MDRLQLVFVEVGRVDGDYDLSELLAGMKADAGFGIRAVVADVVRFARVSEEGGSAWIMVNQALYICYFLGSLYIRRDQEVS